MFLFAVLYTMESTSVMVQMQIGRSGLNGPEGLTSDKAAQFLTKDVIGREKLAQGSSKPIQEGLWPCIFDKWCQRIEEKKTFKIGGIICLK